AGRIIGARNPPRKDTAWPPANARPPLAEVSTDAAIKPVARIARKPAAILMVIASSCLPHYGRTLFPTHSVRKVERPRCRPIMEVGRPSSEPTQELLPQLMIAALRTRRFLMPRGLHCGAPISNPETGR